MKGRGKQTSMTWDAREGGIIVFNLFGLDLEGALPKDSASFVRVNPKP